MGVILLPHVERLGRENKAVHGSVWDMPGLERHSGKEAYYHLPPAPKVFSY